MSAASRHFFKILSHAGYYAYGMDVAGRYRWLEKAAHWTPAQRQQWRLQKLGDILEFAWENVPFYREFWGDHHVSFKRPRSLFELQEFPVLTKDIFRANWQRVVPKNIQTIRHFPKHTGGTTGKPVHYFFDVDHWVTCQAFQIWGWSQTGYRFGEPVGIIAGGSLVAERTSFKGRVRNFAERRLFLFGVHMDVTLAVDYHQQLMNFGAVVLYGYPSVIYLFSKFLREKGLRLPMVKAVITTAEMLLPHYRKGIEENLGCPVFNNFGCNDGGFESFECARHDGFHYNDLQCILETDQTQADGSGRLLITNLWNKSTPFIRYENGDSVVLNESSCACGAVFPRIDSVRGRTADILTFANGTSLAGPALTLIFAPLDIDGWQVVQTGASRLEVRISNKQELQKSEIQHIRNILGKHLTADIEVIIRRTEKLQVTAAGKLKPVWSEIN